MHNANACFVCESNGGRFANAHDTITRGMPDCLESVAESKNIIELEQKSAILAVVLLSFNA
ncbi:MAG: hypothetical protein RML37_11115, partial [Chitinophagales bacterium]|nr:hypothetical protein [Chitinophagales bacterium]